MSERAIYAAVTAYRERVLAMLRFEAERRRVAARQYLKKGENANAMDACADAEIFDVAAALVESEPIERLSIWETK